MSEQPRFCEACGGPLGLGARFCGRCGQAAKPLGQTAAAAVAAPAQAPSPAPAAPPTSAEPIAGVIPALQRRKGLLGYQSFNLIVTPRRLVFTLMTQQMMNDAVRQANDEAKQQGKGLLARMAAQMGWLNVVVRRYASMPVDMALAEQPDNFFVLTSQMRKVHFERHEDRQRHTHTDHVIFEATSGKYEFELKSGQPGEARELLQRVLGAAVR
jgi:quercetin dioxygenase-like cupin family protein